MCRLGFFPQSIVDNLTFYFEPVWLICFDCKRIPCVLSLSSLMLQIHEIRKKPISCHLELMYIFMFRAFPQSLIFNNLCLFWLYSCSIYLFRIILRNDVLVSSVSSFPFFSFLWLGISPELLKTESERWINWINCGPPPHP